MTTEPESKSLLERISALLTPTPSSASEQRKELLETLKEAQADGLIDADALSMIEWRIGFQDLNGVFVSFLKY